MVEIKIVNLPETKAVKEVDIKFEALVKDRNKVIAKRFNMDERDVQVNFHFSKHQLYSAIRAGSDTMGIYCGYLNGTNEINLIHPSTVSTIFGANIDKEFIIMVDYCLTKFYMCKKYFPEKSDFNLFLKHLTEELAKISSGNFRKSIVEFDMKSFVEQRRYSKDKEFSMILYIMLESSGLDYIYEHLDEMVKDKNIKKTVFTIYKKSLWDLIEPYQKAIKEEERKVQLAFRNSRKK